jgi:hypothetical protein
LRLLRLGRAVESGRIEVLSGLDAGETVVLAPPETLRDLDPVQVAEPAAPAAGSPPAATPAGPAAAEARP